MEFECRVVGEEEDEALAYGAGAAKDTWFRKVSCCYSSWALGLGQSWEGCRHGGKGWEDVPHFLTGISGAMMLVFV